MLKYLLEYTVLFEGSQSLIWTGFPYWDLGTVKIHLEQSFLFNFLQCESSLHAWKPLCKLQRGTLTRKDQFVLVKVFQTSPLNKMQALIPTLFHIILLKYF